MSIDIKKLSLGKRKTYRKQSKFLRCYSETRSKSVSALYAGISLSSVSNWIRDNYLEFEERYEEADLAFCEGLEQLALEIRKLAKETPVVESKKVEEKSAIDQVNDILSKKGGMA